MRPLNDRPFLLLGYFALVLSIGGTSLAHATDAPASPEQSAPATGDVQDRGIQRGQFGGTLAPAVILPDRRSGFYCLQSQGKCYCDRTQSGDCDLMKGYVCQAGTYVNTSVLDGECTAKR